MLQNIKPDVKGFRRLKFNEIYRNFINLSVSYAFTKNY